MQKTLVDLFAGAGGLSCGLGIVGFKSLLANEIDPIYGSTFKHNHPETEVVVGDIRELTESDLKRRLGVSRGDITLLAGGPPCQGFSVNAPIRSLGDDRNHLFPQLVSENEARNEHGCDLLRGTTTFRKMTNSL